MPTPNYSIFLCTFRRIQQIPFFTEYGKKVVLAWARSDKSDEKFQGHRRGSTFSVWRQWIYVLGWGDADHVPSISCLDFQFLDISPFSPSCTHSWFFAQNLRSAFQLDWSKLAHQIFDIQGSHPFCTVSLHINAERMTEDGLFECRDMRRFFNFSLSSSIKSMFFSTKLDS